MQSVIYDGSFEGWLSSVFDIYEYRFYEVQLYKEATWQKSIFAAEHFVHTTEIKAARVWNGLSQRLSSAATTQMYRCWLSELPGMDNTLLSYARYAFGSPMPIEKDMSHPAVLTVTDVAKKVYREKHRMEAFVRFQLTKDGLYFAIVEPDYNVLPLILPHFKDRYADQRWMIYDARRKYGIYYDLEEAQQVQLSFEENSNNGRDISAIYDEQEVLYQHLWQRYFQSINIAARKNMKLHIQHMPQRYWKYLTEKR